MTRLGVRIICERCNSPYGMLIGLYYGKVLGDRDIVRGLCVSCRIEDFMEERERMRFERNQPRGSEAGA